MFAVRRIRADEGLRLRSIRLAALADAPGDATTTLARAEARREDHWVEAAAANAFGGLQATFFAELADDDGTALDGEPVGLIGAYANETGIVNPAGIFVASDTTGHIPDEKWALTFGVNVTGLYLVASALLAAVAEWAVTIGADRLRMWVVERNEYAKAFYLNEGFEPTGATIPYELDPRLNQVAMLRTV